MHPFVVRAIRRETWSLPNLTAGLIGNRCGVGLATVFGILVFKKGMPPFFMPWQLPLITLGAIL